MGLPTEVARVTGRLLKRTQLHPLLHRALSGQRVSLCMHRVHDHVRRPGEAMPDMSVDAAALDELIERLRETGLSSLSVTFDDGYADAARYVESRAGRFADVQFLFFVCPSRLEQRTAFSWDLDEQPDATADDERFRLATEDECKALALLPNVRLGNHSNSHHRLSTLSDEALNAELKQSVADFNRLFGGAADFALPFGTPGVAFNEREVRALREFGYANIWSTDPRPRTAADDQTRVLPRYALDGTWTVGEMLAWIAVRAVTSHLKPAQRAA